MYIRRSFGKWSVGGTERIRETRDRLPCGCCSFWFCYFEAHNLKFERYTNQSRNMIFSSFAVLSLLLHPAVSTAVDEASGKVGNPSHRLGQRNKHRRQRSSEGPVRYFTVPGTHKGYHPHLQHDPRDRHLQNRIVGGDESDVGEFPYYGTNEQGRCDS